MNCVKSVMIRSNVLTQNCLMAKIFFVSLTFVPLRIFPCHTNALESLNKSFFLYYHPAKFTIIKCDKKCQKSDPFRSNMKWSSTHFPVFKNHIIRDISFNNPKEYQHVKFKFNVKQIRNISTLISF